MANVILADSLIAAGMAAPSMKERQLCWGARDEYWKCLDENTEDTSKCKKLRSSFESSCPQQWVSPVGLLNLDRDPSHALSCKVQICGDMFLALCTRNCINKLI